MQLTIVEDNDRTRARIVQLLVAQIPHIKIAQFNLLTNAKLFARSHRQDYWLIDLGLPDGSGIDLIRWIRQHDTQTHILVISVFGDVDNIVHSIQAGANGYLLKDAIEKDLVQAVAALGEGGSPLSPMIASRLLERMVSTTSPNQPINTNTTKTELTHREIELLDLLARGYKYAEVATFMNIALSTVQTFIRRIYTKLAVSSRSEAIFEAKQQGLLAP